MRKHSPAAWADTQTRCFITSTSVPVGTVSAREIQEVLARIDHETPWLWINDLRSDLWSKFLWNKRHVRCTVFDAVIEGSAVEIIRFRRRLRPSVPCQLSKR